MKSTLTIQEKLKDLRVERGLTLEELAAQTGLSKSALGNYEIVENKDIGHYSIIKLAKFYGVSTDYLLGLSESRSHPNAELSELHLSDAMIELLKSGKINTRLLCEIAAQEGFVKLMADIEIYVDGIASMQVQNLNAWVGIARDEIVAKHHPGEDDPYIRLMDAAQINEDNYFRNIVHDDIDSIIGSIREAHKSDSESAPATSGVVGALKKGMEVAANFEGSLQEKQLVALCEQLGIDYSKLTEEEFRIMMRVFQKSPLFESLLRQRGKPNRAARRMKK